MSKFKWTHVALLILLCAVFALSRTVEESKKKLDRANQDLTEVNKAYEINKESLSTLKRNNDELKKQIKEFKDVETVTIVETSTVIDTVVFNIPGSGNDTTCIFERNLVVDTTFYSFDFTYTNKSFTINRLSIPNKLSIVVGDKKVKGWTGLAKGTEYSIDVVSSNPYVNTTNFQTYKVVKEKKWYESPWFLVGVGFVSAAIIIN